MIGRVAVLFVALSVFVPCLVAQQKTHGDEKGRRSAQKQAKPAAAGEPTEMEGFDTFIEQALKDWKVPGIAVAVVKGDKVILLKGYGFRDLEKHLPVTPQTLFAIGSITKSFTVTTLGMLMDEGKVDWDEPVRTVFPKFKMYDPVLTEQMSVRDLITHRSGLPRHDAVWYTSDFSREELVSRLQYLEPSKPLRSTFQYNNLMFMTAGYIAGQLNGTSWEDAVRARILGPLGMAATNFSELATQNAPDFAEPYRKGSDMKAEVKRIPFDAQCPDTCALGPAGEVNSNATDLSTYLIFHMNKGKFSGRQLLSENNSIQMQIPQMTIAGAPDFAEQSESSYGMGFFVSGYRGHKEVAHGGNLDGFSAALAFLPADQIGVVVLTNLDGTPLPQVVAYNVYDRLLGLEQVGWSKRFLGMEQGGKQGEQEAKDKGYTAHKSGTRPSHDLTDYLGEYSNPGYGKVTILPDGDGFKLTLNKVNRVLKHYHYDVFEVPDGAHDDFAKLKVIFFSDLRGEIDSLSMPLETNVRDIVFKRVPDKQLSDRSFIEAFTGQYELPGAPAPLTITIRGDHALVGSMPGQEDLELLPRRGTTFEVKGLAGFSIEFKKDASGRVTEAVFYQPDTVVVLKKKQ
jgi:CubicO group peptidase (beta-lactamase class C family)